MILNVFTIRGSTAGMDPIQMRWVFETDAFWEHLEVMRLLTRLDLRKNIEGWSAYRGHRP